MIAATIRNQLSDSTLRIYGLVTRPAAVHDSLVIPPGESRLVTFAAGAPGSYLYWASLGVSKGERDAEREQLAGAFVVDPPGGSPPDRVLVVNIWGTRTDSVTYRNALAINGRSWPHTERIEATVGDTLRWRVLNGSRRNHPMHLHGFYFRVGARGDVFADTLYSAAAQRMVVTEGMRPRTTFAMTWVAERAGNWLFHCHLGFHVVPSTRLHPPHRDSGDRMAHDAGTHMAGLVLGIAVRPRPDTPEPARGKARRLHLFVQEGLKRGRAPRAMGFVLQRDGRPPAADSVVIPGSVLVLTRGQPTDIVIVNRLSEPTAIHWHGIELESYSDGVTGWSGAGDRLAPSVMPGDSFTARLTLPRAGTFMYHTHLNDIEQLTSGLYGGIVVLEPGKRFDPQRDHLFVTGWDGETPCPGTAAPRRQWRLPACATRTYRGRATSFALRQHRPGWTVPHGHLPGHDAGFVEEACEGRCRPPACPGDPHALAVHDRGGRDLRLRVHARPRQVSVEYRVSGQAALVEGVGGTIASDR